MLVHLFQQLTESCREDHGWLVEPDGVPASSDQMMAVLADVQGLYIRGDFWTYSKEGSGQEIVYINDITLHRGF